MNKKIIISVIIICLIMTSCSSNTDKYEKAKKLFIDESYYESISEYYEKLNNSQKQKINNMILEKVENKTWKSEESFIYTNYNNCEGNDYAKISKEYVELYVMCHEKNGDEQKEGYEKNSTYFILDKIEDEKIQFQVGGIYIIIDKLNNIYLESQSVNSSENYTISHHKFKVVE